MPRKPKGKLPPKYRNGLPKIEDEPDICIQTLSSPVAPQHLLRRRANKIGFIHILKDGSTQLQLHDDEFTRPHLIELTRATREIADGRAWAILQQLEALGLTAQQCDAIRASFRDSTSMGVALGGLAAADREHHIASRSKVAERRKGRSDEDEVILCEVEGRMRGSSRSMTDVASELSVALEDGGQASKDLRKKLGISSNRRLGDRSILRACKQAQERRDKLDSVVTDSTLSGQTQS